jgi:hypothetical protein
MDHRVKPGDDAEVRVENLSGQQIQQAAGQAVAGEQYFGRAARQKRTR